MDTLVRRAFLMASDTRVVDHDIQSTSWGCRTHRKVYERRDGFVTGHVDGTEEAPTFTVIALDELVGRDGVDRLSGIAALRRGEVAADDDAS
jgi:hypothetical protein